MGDRKGAKEIGEETGRSGRKKEGVGGASPKVRKKRMGIVEEFMLDVREEAGVKGSQFAYLLINQSINPSTHPPACPSSYPSIYPLAFSGNTMQDIILCYYS